MMSSTDKNPSNEIQCSVTRMQLYLNRTGSSVYIIRQPVITCTAERSINISIEWIHLHEWVLSAQMARSELAVIGCFECHWIDCAQSQNTPQSNTDIETYFADTPALHSLRMKRKLYSQINYELDRAIEYQLFAKWTNVKNYLIINH